MKRHLLITIALALLIAATLHSHAQNRQPAPRSIAERLGYPANSRLLVIQSDIGMMHAINRATFEAVEKRWITSATVLPAAPWFPEAADFARRHPDGDYGLHLMLNSEWTPFRWSPVLGGPAVPSLIDADGYFPLTEDAIVKNAKPEEIERELRAQIEKSKKAGIAFTHFDSHMDTLFATPQLFEIYRRLGREYRVPVLAIRGVVERLKIPQDGLIVFDRRIEMRPGIPYPQWVDAYKKMLAPLPPGLYMLSVHLGYDDPEHRGATAGHENWGAAWRQADFDVIRNPEFQRFLKEQGFVMVTFGELQKKLGQ
jgi:predicted glycoside hydrolase/deacetylase ChbG (UPF0249 family)